MRLANKIKIVFYKKRLESLITSSKESVLIRNAVKRVEKGKSTEVVINFEDIETMIEKKKKIQAAKIHKTKSKIKKLELRARYE